MKLLVTATFVAQYNLAIVVGRGRSAGATYYGYMSSTTSSAYYGSISYNTTGRTIDYLRTNVYGNDPKSSFQATGAFPATVRRIDTGASITFSISGPQIRGELFNGSDEDKTIYLSVS